MNEQVNISERAEEAVQRVMRAARDEKIRLDATIAEKIHTIADLLEERDKLNDERVVYLKRTTKLETDLRAIGAIINETLLALKPLPNSSFPSEPVRGVSDGTSGEASPNPRFNKRPYD